MKRKPLTTDDCKVVFGGTFGDPAPKHKLQIAIEQADEADAIRRRDKPTREELAAALASGEELTSSDCEHLRRAQLGIAKSAGRPADSKNALLARDGLMYFEYAKLLGKGHEKSAAKAIVGRKFRVGIKTVEAAITRAHKLYRKDKDS